MQSLAYRISLHSAVGVLVAVFLLGLLLTDWYIALSYATGVAFMVLVVVATVIHFTVKARMTRLTILLRAINSRQFEVIDESAMPPRDELDLILAETIRTSNTIEKELQRLVKLENYRKDFIGDISHELKTPIFAIQGFLETLLDGALEDEEVNREFLKKAMRNVNRLTVLTRDLMEIAKLETGELKSNITATNLRDIMLEVIETLQYKAEEESVEIKMLDVDPDLKVNADRNQLRQVFVNLIENAIKYNKPGGEVTIGLKGYHRMDPKVWVFVRDTGIGIDQRDLNRVTERFFRVDKSRSRDKGGTGLGLAIVKHILESHGERLKVDSTPGKGTTFTFTLQVSPNGKNGNG